jgi:hypothetical protein
MCPQNAYSVDIVFAWDANTENDLDGYKIFCRGEGESYNYDNPVLEVHFNEPGENPQEPTCTIYNLNLEDNITHYFVIRAFDTTGLESIDSNEVCYPIDTDGDGILSYDELNTYNTDPNIADSDGDGILDDDELNIYNTDPNIADSDGDGILDDDELNIYNTDPNIADSDGDGINDGDELAFWGNNWDADYDSDGIVNLLDNDSDNDGYFDGFEIKQGSDSSDPNSVPAYSSWTDYRLTLTIRSVDDDAIGVMFRYQDNANYYRFSWDRQRNYRRLVKQENGEFVVLAEDTALYVLGETYELEVVADGSVLEIWIDGSPIFIVEDGSFSAGSFALYSWGNCGSYFNDVYVEDLATGAVLLSEDFNNDEFSNWNIVDEGNLNGPSAWSAMSGILVQSSNIHSAPTDAAELAKFGTFALYVLSEDDPEPVTSWTDYRLTLTIRSVDDDAIGVMFRYQDNANYYRFSWDRQRNYRRLVKQENSEFVVLAEDTARYVPGETYELEVVADGSVLEIWIDGSPIFIVEDGSFSAGSIALYSWGNRGSYFNDVYVEDLATGAVLLSEDFNNGEFSNWNIVDEANLDGPSAWSAASGILVQSSNIYSNPTDAAELAKFGTFVLY